MVESAGEASDVGDDPAPHDEDGLVPGHAHLLQVDQDLLHVVDLLVDLVALRETKSGLWSVSRLDFSDLDFFLN